MNVVPVPIGRVPTLLQSSMLMSTLQGSQSDMLTVQNQISTGQRLNLASDDPAAALGIQQLNRTISNNDQFTSNINFASSFLNTADNTLSTLTDLINQAKSIASSQIGTGSTADERTAQAQVVSSLLSRVLDLSNTRYANQSVFGGQNGTEDAFTSVGGGFKYQGSQAGQGILTPTGSEIPYTLNGNQVFGGLSSQVIGYRNLTPAVNANTRLADLNGATLAGVHPGTINVTIGAATVAVDLSQAATAGDVVNLVNNALTTAGSDASLSLSGGSIVVTGDSTQNITIADPANGQTAANLGLAGTIASTTTVTGAPLGPKITATTQLADLANGAGIDPTGIKITNGANSATISLSGLTTVEDLLNAVNNSGTNVHAEINAAGTGINLFNPLSGSPLTIGENGGNTADQLGIRSFNASTNLSELNMSGGVTPISQNVSGPTGQFIVTKTDGTTFAVTVDGIKTPSQLIAAINAATGNGTVTAALNATGNGISLTDISGGAGNLTVTGSNNFVSNGSVLGIFTTGSGGTLTGSNISFSTDDFRVSRRDGSSFTVNLTGAVTVQDVIAKINSADGNTNPATQVTASLNTTGNGLELSDASAGAGTLTVSALNASAVPQQLGILKTAGSATPGVINGDDVNPLQPTGLFSSLALLRDSLLKNDNSGIMRAAQLLDQDNSRVIQANGTVGARVKDLAGRKTDITNEQVQLKTSLSTLQDTDMTSAITQFQAIQTAYSAALKVAQSTNNMSLLDFLK